MQISEERRMTESLCDDNKFYDYICHVILFSLYFNKHIKYTKLQELRNPRRRISTYYWLAHPHSLRLNF